MESAIQMQDLGFERPFDLVTDGSSQQMREEPRASSDSSPCKVPPVSGIGSALSVR